MSATPDVLIVGAGIVGAACAFECARSGLSVGVIHEGPVGSGTTAAGMGHLVVMDDSEEQFALTRLSCDLWRELRPELPTGAEYDPCGTLWVAADDEEMAEVDRKARFYGERGVAVERVDGAEVARIEPNLRPALAGGLRVPGDAVIYPPRAARWLLDRAVDRGARVERVSRVVRIEDDGVACLEDGSVRRGGIVVNAAGADSPRLTPGIPVRKRKGHLVITERYPGFARHQIIELGYLKSAHAVGSDSVAFNIQPRITGQMLIGSSRQFDAPGTEVEPSILARMLRRAREFMPAIPDLIVLRAWTGHRAATPDKLPLIGPTAEGSRTWLATGHEGLGITTSIGTARLLADRLLGRDGLLSWRPYAPTRLGDEVAHA